MPTSQTRSLDQPGLLCGNVHRAGTRIIVQFPDEMREHLRVSIGAKLCIAITDELILERLVIFDDAIVN